MKKTPRTAELLLITIEKLIYSVLSMSMAIEIKSKEKLVSSFPEFQSRSPQSSDLLINKSKEEFEKQQIKKGKTQNFIKPGKISEYFNKNSGGSGKRQKISDKPEKEIPIFRTEETLLGYKKAMDLSESNGYLECKLVVNKVKANRFKLNAICLQNLFKYK